MHRVWGGPHARPHTPGSPSMMAALSSPRTPAGGGGSAARAKAGQGVWITLGVCVACVLLLALHLQGTQHMLLALRQNSAAAAWQQWGGGNSGGGGSSAAQPWARDHTTQPAQQQSNASRQQQQQQQQSNASRQQPCVMELNNRDVVRFAATQFKYESPFIDSAGFKNPAFARLPHAVVPPLGAAAVTAWRELQPHMRFHRRMSSAMYNGCDTSVLFAMVRLLKPRRVFEVGSGFSTRVVNRALRANAAEAGAQPPAQHLCIEPYRSAMLADLQPHVQVLQQRVQEVDLALFDQLEAGDLLFLDNSHVIRPYGDVLLELLWVLPRLKPGVLVHVHDIFLPYEYPADWMLGELRPYTEQYLLAAFLYGNKDWEVVLQTGRALKEVLPPAELDAWGRSTCGVQGPGSAMYIRRRLVAPQDAAATAAAAAVS